MEIQKKDLDQIFKAHQGSALLKNLLKNIKDEKGLLSFLTQYAQFNSVFGSCVAVLAGITGLQRHLFIDSKEKLGVTKDRSVLVASKIFYAAIDEFGGERCLMDHRSMAQKMLKEAGAFFKEESSDCLEAAFYDRIARGYGVWGEKIDQRIFTGIGFHIGSEILADKEFQIINEYLRSEHSDLVNYLESVNAYHWVQVHTIVEVEHFDAALKAANLSLKYFVGNTDKARELIIDGMRNFADVQLELLQSLSKI